MEVGRLASNTAPQESAPPPYHSLDLVRMGLDALTAEVQIRPKKTPAFRGWELVHDRFRDRQEAPYIQAGP